MSEQLVFQPSAAAIARTHVTKAQYDEMYARSISDPDGFWARAGQAP
jgi:acetyl-CoA synthetase